VPPNYVIVNNSLVSGCYICCDAWMTCGNDTFDNSTAAGDGYGWFTNCIFSSMANIIEDIYDYGPVYVGSHNAFYNTTAFGDTTVSFDGNYQGGPLGNYYLSSSSACIDAGNVTADQVGLYWWTTQTSPSSMEGTSIVDLGYHYPALDGYGNPVETEDDTNYDYVEDPNGSGLPDWWQIEYFGNINQYASELDGLGNTLFYDYTNGVDLSTTVQFTIQVTNNYVSNSYPGLQLNITAGVPFYIAVLVDSTNFGSASWAACTSTNLTVYLGTTEGWHDIWVGLQGVPSNPQQTWEWRRLKYDVTPPQLVITGPTNSTVNVPVIQLTGYSPEALGSYSYDLTNATGLVTNQQVLVLNQFYDTNTEEFTTNYFQCFDVPLTNGLNTFTIHATDLAGKDVYKRQELTLHFLNLLFS